MRFGETKIEVKDDKMIEPGGGYKAALIHSLRRRSLFGLGGFWCGW